VFLRLPPPFPPSLRFSPPPKPSQINLKPLSSCQRNAIPAPGTLSLSYYISSSVWCLFTQAIGREVPSSLVPHEQRSSLSPADLFGSWHFGGVIFFLTKSLIPQHQPRNCPAAQQRHPFSLYPDLAVPPDPVSLTSPMSAWFAGASILFRCWPLGSPAERFTSPSSGMLFPFVVFLIPKPPLLAGTAFIFKTPPGSGTWRGFPLPLDSFKK